MPVAAVGTPGALGSVQWPRFGRERCPTGMRRGVGSVPCRGELAARRRQALRVRGPGEERPPRASRFAPPGLVPKSPQTLGCQGRRPKRGGKNRALQRPVFPIRGRIRGNGCYGRLESVLCPDRTCPEIVTNLWLSGTYVETWLGDTGRCSALSRVLATHITMLN